MFQRERFNVFQGMADLGFGLSGALIVILFILILVIGREDEDESGVKPGSLMVNIIWDRHLDNGETDVDLWLRDPNGQTIGYSRQSSAQALWTLLKDDTGYNSHFDTSKNEEWAFTTGIVEGEYQFNLHLFSLREDLPVAVWVQISFYPPNGNQRMLLNKTVKLNFAGEELTVLRIVLTDKGREVSRNTEPRNIRLRTEGR